MSKIAGPSCSLLDLLDAITEVRVRNPDLRPAVLSALRLAESSGHIEAGRLYSLRHDGEVAAIIAHGKPSHDEEADLDLVRRLREERQTLVQGKLRALPLGKEQRLYGALLLEGAEEDSAAFLADLFLQWHAVAEFLNVQKEELLDENFHLREEIRQSFSPRNIIGASGSFRRVLECAQRVAPSTATVLIQGETGTGKELIARLIHDHSPRANAAFITVNCGALTETLLETELFGHAKGAFTGAVADHKGKFEAAHDGTIFLDEIGEVSPAMQVRLLRVLQEMEVVRVGETTARKLNVRVVAATNRDLEQEMAAGRFRADLFYRLNVVHLAVPPLRQRSEDIPLLFEHFLSIYCQRNCTFIAHVSKDVLEIMRSYHWPGNIRELENCVEKMVVMAPGSEITPDLLPMALVSYTNPESPDRVLTSPETLDALLQRFMQAETTGAIDRGGGDLYETVRAKWERHLFEAVLASCRNNKSKAARLLGITRNTLSARLDALCEVTRTWSVD